MDEKGMFVEENAYKMSKEKHPDDAAKLENAKKLFDICKKGHKRHIISLLRINIELILI